MSKVLIDETTLTGIGDAIRGKTGKTDLIQTNNMETEITNLPDDSATINYLAEGQYLDEWSSLIGNEDLEEISLPNATRICDYAFYNRPIKKVYAPKVTVIGQRAFDSGENKDYCLLSKDCDFSSVKIVNESAFGNRCSMAPINFPSIEAFDMGSYGMQECQDWKNFKHISNVKYLTGRFDYMTNVQKIVLPNIVYFGIEATQNCYFRTVWFPNLGNVPAEGISIENPITKKPWKTNITPTINGYFVSNYITVIVIGGDKNVPTLSFGFQGDTDSRLKSGDCYIYVSKALIEQYKVATNWAQYADQFRAIEDYPEIVEEAMKEE